MLEKSISQGGQFKEYFPMNWDDHLTGFIENEWMEKKIEGEAHMNSFSDVSGYVSYGNIILQYLIIEIMQIFQLVHLDHRKLEAPVNNTFLRFQLQINGRQSIYYLLLRNLSSYLLCGRTSLHK